MADASQKGEAHGEALGCPFMDTNDARCARHFSLGRLSEAFSICLNGFNTCDTYYQLRTEHGTHDEPIKIRPAPGRGSERLRRTGT